MNEPKNESQMNETMPAHDGIDPDLTQALPPARDEELKLSELLILAAMWMLFGFMLWFYLSAFHGAPARMIADFVLSEILGDSFRQIIVEPNQHFLFQVETNIQYVFKDGTQEALGFIVNPLIYSYGLPLLFGLVMGSDVSWLRKAVIMLVGYVAIMLVQVWGVVFQSLKMLSFNFGEQSHVFVTQAGVSDSTVALGYQLGTLILPALMPIFVWVLGNRPLVEQFVGWSADALRKDNN
jgi:hypothetical protein